MLYPQQNDLRNRIDLSGLWSFGLDAGGRGEEEGWFQSLPEPRLVAIPASWNEQFQDTRDYMGPVWYVRETYVPSGWQGQRILLRIGSANYAAKIWVNGAPVGEHEGGHLPFEFEITELIKWGRPNQIAIRVENELTPTRVPPGNVSSISSLVTGGYPATAFDFFPYAGLHRPVILYSAPASHVKDITIATEIDAEKGLVEIEIVRSDAGEGSGRVSVQSEDEPITVPLAFENGVARAEIEVPNARLWSPEKPHLYRLTAVLTEGQAAIDRYSLDIGIRTVQVEGDSLLLNGEPVFLRGFGRHEDSPIHGRGLNIPLIVKDAAVMKWVGANSFRTSHYPYSEEAMQLADQEGFLVIDETPAVGLFFDDSEANINARLEQCRRQLQELIARDKNHPCVIMWSVANEPLAGDPLEQFAGGEVARERVAVGTAFLNELLNLARSLDPTRPATLAGVMAGPVEWLSLCDLVCINRYWGWYTQGGQLQLGDELLGQELDELHRELRKPMILSEFGAGALAGSHSDPPEMWTEEYQVELLRLYLDAAEKRPFVVGAHVWNLADFKTAQSSTRVGGMNLKGVFTRDRRPKMAAHFLRERWAGLDRPQQCAEPSTGSTQALPTKPGSFGQVLQEVTKQLEDKFPHKSTTVQFAVESEGTYRLVIESGRARVEEGEGTAAATISLKTRDGIRLLRGELNPMVALVTRRIRVEGDVQSLVFLKDLV